MSNTSIIYGIYNNTNYKRISESYKKNKNNPVRNLRGDSMEINKELQDFRNEFWLRDRYIIDKKDAVEIAKECKCSSTTIYKWMDKFNIPRRNQSEINDKRRGNKLYCKKEWIEEQYINQKLSIYQIAEKCECNPVTIWGWLRKYNIPMRDGQWKKGHMPWNKDKKGIFSEESKRKMSESKKGIIPWNKGKDCPQLKGNKNSHWKGGKHYSNEGYVYVLKSMISWKKSNGYIQEHRLIMEENLKRGLWDWEVVHHINGIKDDNRIENLYLCNDNRHHMRIHNQLGRIAQQLLRSQKLGKIVFDYDLGEYYIVFGKGAAS